MYSEVYVLRFFVIFIMLLLVSNAKVNLSLYDIAKTFLDVEMDKSERIGNWVQRPMRLERKAQEFCRNTIVLYLG